MVDYKAWGAVDPITVEDAAYLWAGIDPSTYSFDLTAEQRGAFIVRLRMLTSRIQNKTLTANTDSNPAAFIGVHDKSLVTRADLRIVAEALGEQPRFLFAASNEESQEGETASSGAAATKAEPEPTPTALSQAGLDKATISHLFGPEITKAPDSSPSPLRVVPGARRITKAPPPPHYVRETIGSLPTRAPVAAPVAPSPALEAKPPPDLAPSVFRTEAVPDDKIIKAWLVREQARRIGDKAPCGLNEVRVYLRGEFPHLSRDDADRFYEALDPDLKPRRGPKRPWKNKRSQ